MLKRRKIGISYERGRQVLLFLFCLFLAFVLWAIRNLSDYYSVNLNYSVHVVTQKRGHSAEAFSDNKLSVTGRASGFYILQNRLGIQGNLINLSVPGRLLKPVPGTEDKFFFVVSEVSDIITDALSGHVEIESFSSDTLYLTLPRQSHRNIPVAVDYTARFKDQYMPVGKIKLSPSTVTVYGDMSLLQNIDSVRTKHITFERLSSSRSGTVELLPVSGLRFETKEIYYTLEVVRYVEISTTIPVESVNVPEDKYVKFFPNTVRVTYRIPFSNKQNRENTIFVATIDYKEITASISNTVEPMVSGLPENVLSVELDPKFIKCKIIEQ
jgi:hypothetical protein